MTRFTGIRRLFPLVPSVPGQRSAAPMATRLNLTTDDAVTPWFLIGPHNKLCVEVIAGSTYTWATAVFDLQWTLCPNNNNANDFSPAVQGDTDAKYLTNASVTNRGYWRLKTSTGEPANDPAATVLWSLR